jgi:GT2 family glycosyltransferase
MAKPGVDLSVIIVSMNTRDLVRDCLGSVYASAPKRSFEIIVVDNASTDGSCEAIENEYPEVRLIRNVQNAGFSVANNQALEIACGENLLLLNSDTIVPLGSLDQMLEAMRKDDRIGVISPRLVFGDGSLQLSYGPMPGPFVAFCTFFEVRRLFPRSLLAAAGRSQIGRIFGSTVGIYAGWLGSDSLPTKEIGPNLYVSGACMLIRRACYEQVGRLDTNYFMYVDDADYSKRVHDAGWKILYLAETTVIHLQGGTGGRRYRWTSAPAYLSMLYFQKKHRGAWAFHISKAFAIAAVFGRWVVDVVSGSTERRSTWRLLTELTEYQAPL